MQSIKKELKKELMLVPWHPRRWWKWCIPEDEKRKRDRTVIH